MNHFFGVSQWIRHGRKWVIVLLAVILLASVPLYFWNRSSTISRTMRMDLPKSEQIEDYKVKNSNLYAKIKISYEDFQNIISSYEGTVFERQVNDVERSEFEHSFSISRDKTYVNADTMVLPAYEEYFQTTVIGGADNIFGVSTGSAEVYMVARINGDCYLFVVGNILS